MYEDLLNQRCMVCKTKQKGRITAIKQDKIQVTFNYGNQTIEFPFPAALDLTLELEDEELQERYRVLSHRGSLDSFKKIFKYALDDEIAYLRATGGKRYRIIDGEKLSTGKNTYVYLFETDSELHFPDGTAIRLWFSDGIVFAYVVSCEDFTITIQTTEYIGEKIDTVEFTAEPWQLLESLEERLQELDADRNPIAYELACAGRTKIDQRRSIELGQALALRRSTEQPITFIWGPPGTGKTTTLAKIAMEHMGMGERVLMLSYSNVSVDGAILRVANMSDMQPGQIIRYGYPRVPELLESTTLTSYSYVLSKNPKLVAEYNRLEQTKKHLKKNNSKRIEVQKEIGKIREKLREAERELICQAAFVATTVSKAVVDKSVYSQNFDVVIFDEASMAYVPQIVFAASLAKKHFCCLGDFKQLPAIVQNPSESLLRDDIFEHTGITAAVENGYGHEWLVMLNYQYRMHPRIASFVSRYMYEDLLKSPESIYEQRQTIADLEPMQSEPMSLVDLSNTYSVCIKTMDGSRINLMSAMMCMNLAEFFAGRYNVGIITPYSAQSRLILAMIRDLRERNSDFKSVTCATVHQFQGSEKPIIIYDAVDCFRMPYPGSLLTSKKNDTANRLFNVALTRTQGKFILVANVDFLRRKKIAQDLIFTRFIKKVKDDELYIEGDDILNEVGTYEGETPEMFLGGRDERDSWERFLEDIRHAETEIFMDIPGPIDKDEQALSELASALSDAERKGILIGIRAEVEDMLPECLKNYAMTRDYITTPLTMIDRKLIWLGEPLSAAEFISEGKTIETKSFLCLRFEGIHTAKMIKALYEIPNLKKG